MLSGRVFFYLVDTVQHFLFCSLSLSLSLSFSPSFSWLLRDPDMRLRSAYEPYLIAINRYFTELFKILVPLQSMYGGPIIAFQIENEFAHHPHTSDLEGQEYMFALHGVRKLP